jgi:hypothetical protein
MTRKNKLLLKRTATLKNTSLLAVLVMIMMFFIMPDANTQIRQYAPNTSIIDTLFFYFPDQLYRMISEYGSKGRSLYIAVELTVDLFFFIVIAAFLCFFLIWSSSKNYAKTLKIEFLVFLPLLLIVANCLENGGIVWMLIFYPKKFFYLALLTSFFTFLKWILIISCLGIAGWHVARIFYKKVKVFRNKRLEKSIANS